MLIFFLSLLCGIGWMASAFTMHFMQARFWRILLAFSLLFSALESTDPVYAARSSKRLQYVGRTPGKKSKTGRAVLKRWHENGKARMTSNSSGIPDYSQPDQWEVHVYTFDSASKTMSTTREWLPLDGNIAMGHKLAAVDFWNKGASGSKIYSPTGALKKKAIKKARYKPYREAGRKGQARSEIVRKFMLDPSNYRFEHLPANSHFGALMPDTYRPPKN